MGTSTSVSKGVKSVLETANHEFRNVCFDFLILASKRLLCLFGSP